MFGFMKKLSDKDKEEKERKKKERFEKEQKKISNGLTADELIRLEEARQSLQLKSVSVSLKACSDNINKTPTNVEVNPVKGPPPAIHPKPTKRGLLKDRGGVMPQKENSTSISEIAVQNANLSGKAIASLEKVSAEKESDHKKILNSSLKRSKVVIPDGNVRLINARLNDKSLDIKPVTDRRSDSPVNKLYEKLQNKMAPLIPMVNLERRTISLKRLQSGGFGFSLRKGVTVIRKSKPKDSDVWKPVIFAEPGSKNINLGFLPGDSIIEVGKLNVESSNRETIVDILKKSGNQVDVVVQTVPELSELVLRLTTPDAIGSSWGSKHNNQAKTEDQLVSDQLSLTSNSVWLIHKGGYSLGRLLESSGDGSVRVELDPGDVIEATEQDIERVNPTYLDRIEDATLLRFVNESSLLHLLRQRYASNLIHTYAGFSTLVINSVHPLSLYSDKIAQFFKETRVHDLPPHIFSVSQSAFKTMMNTRQDQSIVLVGGSGSGKTFHAQNILSYFLTAHGSVQSVLTSDKLSAISTLLESFGSCKTMSGFSSTKFTQIFSLDFDQNGQIVSASLQALMLEKTKLLRKVVNETSFNIFSHFINGIDSDLRKELHLENVDLSRSFFGISQASEDLTKATQSWHKDLSSFKNLNISPDEVKAFCFVLAAICHLGLAEVVKGPNDKHQFKNNSSVQSAAHLLGTTVDELSKTIFQGNSIQVNNSLSPGLRIATSRENVLANYSGSNLLDHFVTGLYAELFNALVALINRSLSSSCRTTASILIVDAPGFRGTPTSGGAASLEDLFCNYVQERLQNLFYETVFVSAHNLYAQEGIGVDFEFPEPYSPTLVQLIDNPPQNLTRSPECGGNLSSNRGLLWVLDEQSLLSTTADDGLVEVLRQECSHFQLKSPMMLPGSSSKRFVLNHLNGTSPVEYDVSGWLKAAQEGALGRVIGPLLMDSKRREISELFWQTCKSVGAGVMSGSIVGVVDAPSSLRRVSSMKRTFASGAAAVKKRSLCLQVKFQSDAMHDMLKRTRASFVHCISPRPGSTDCQDVLDLPFLRTQLRSYLILSSVRLFKQGYPEHMSFSEFLHKYGILVRLSSTDCSRNTVEQVLRGLEVDNSSCRVGSTKVFFHSGVLNQLESKKEEMICNWLIRLQSLCRLRLAQKNLQKLKLQHMAVACLQRNVRKFMAVKGWPWWRLYTRIKPVLNVHKTEEDLRDMQFEVDQLKQRVERSEKEKQEYKQAYEMLEIKMTELTMELQDEHNTAMQASEMLENETAQRLHMEREYKELQNKYNVLQGQFCNMETEFMNMKMLSNSIESDADDDLGDSVYKERYERAKRESEYAKKKMEMRFEEQKDELESSRRILEKKLAEMQLEEESREKASSDARKKLQKQSQEMADLNIHLAEQVARNSELEKKQRRFDNELAKVNDGLKEERSLRERFQKEKDDLIGQKYAIEQQHKNMEVDYEMQSQKLRKVELEVMDLMMTGKDDRETVKMRQMKCELEGKIKDLEEELDEQAGTIQQLEQAKLRLEMSQEKLRQQHSREIEEKENDLEEFKRNSQKKCKTMEMQLEEEYEERQRCLKEKREVERKLQTVAEERPARDKDVEALLKRDLRRTKALLQDAQLMLQKYKENAGSRQTVKHLRDQLEDAEFATAAALKAKKSMELEVNDLQQQLENMTKLKNEAEERFVSVNKDKHELVSRVEENDEEMADLMKKYKTAVQQHSLDVLKFDEQSHQIELLQQEKESLKEEMAKLQSRRDYFEASMVDRETISRLEAKIRDLEAKLDLEQTTKRRAEIQLTRLKEQLEAETDSRQSMKSDEMRVQEQVRQLQRKVKEAEDELSDLRLKESDAARRKQELERKLEEMQVEHEQTQSDLHLAFKRIADLQAVIEDDIETNNSEESDADVQCSDDDDI